MKALLKARYVPLLIATIFLNGEAGFSSTYCLPGIGCVGPGGVETTLTTFNVYIDNLSSYPVDVTVQSYKQPNTSGKSCPGGGTSCLPNGWRKGTWHLSPGEQDVFVLDDVEGRNIYVEARATDGSGKSWKFEADMGSVYTRYDIGLGN